MRWFCAALDPSAEPTRVETWMGRHGPVHVVGRQAGPGLVEACRVWDGDHVLILAHPLAMKAARYVATVASGALPHIAFSVVPVGVNLLAICLLADDAADLPEPAGAALSIQQRAREVRSGAWLAKVTQLKAPNPSFFQHVRSYFPSRAGFVAATSPVPGVVSATKLVGHPGGGNLFVSWGGREDAVARIGAAYQRQPIPVSPVVDTREAHGSPGFEFAVIPAETPALPAPSQRCRVCGLPIYAPSCAFCHVVSIPEGSRS